jgi:hypothetical protein
MNKSQIFFKGFTNGFKAFPHTVTNIVNFVLLMIVYVFGVGLVSAISKLFGKHFIFLKKSGNKSNWKDHKVSKEPLEKYYRTF